MMLTTWPVRALFKYVFHRVLGTFIKTDVNLDDIDFSLKSFSLSDIEMNTYEINKLLTSDPSNPSPFKLVSMTIKNIDIPWGIIKFNWAEIKIQGIEVILMPSPTKTKKPSYREDRHNEENKEEGKTSDQYDSEVSLSSSLVTKFLANIGLSIKDVVVKLLPLEFGKEYSTFEKIPTLMFRLDHLKFEKQQPKLSKAESDTPLTSSLKADLSLDHSLSTSSASASTSPPLPSIFKILKKKHLSLGQITIHLLSCPLGSELFTSPKFVSNSFPFTFPPAHHPSTLLCLGHPSFPSEPSLSVSLSPTLSNRFELSLTSPCLEAIIDPLQISTLNSFLKRLDHVWGMPWEQEQEANVIEEISSRIRRDFKEDDDSEMHTVVEEIRKGVDIEQLVVDKEGTVEGGVMMDFGFNIKIVAVTVVHGWTNASRWYDRIFDSINNAGNSNPWGIRKHTDICIPASHFLFEMRNLYINGGYSKNARLNINVKEVALFDYILSDWRLPTSKELKTGTKILGTHQIGFNTMTEKDLKRRSMISRIWKSSMKRSTIRGAKQPISVLNRSVGNKNIIGEGSEYASVKDENEKDDDDNMSFKSFAMDLEHETRSNMSSTIHESEFMDANDEDGIWFLNPYTQHFSTIPILTIKSLQTICKSTAKKDETKTLFTSISSKKDLEQSLNKSCVDSAGTHQRIHFQLSHHLISQEVLDWNDVSESESEEEIKMESSENSHESFDLSSELTNAIEIKFYFTKHDLKNSNKKVFLMDIDIRTQSIFLELTPWSVIHVWSMLNPFEYFYNSSVDFAQPIFKEFIHQTYRLPKSDVKLIEEENKESSLIVGDVKISQIPYISCLFFFYKNESEQLQNLYQEHIGNYVDQNHFITKDEYIADNGDLPSDKSYAYDMLLKYLEITDNLPKPPECTMYNKFSLFIEFQKIRFYYEPNINEIDLRIGQTMVSLIKNVDKLPMAKVNNVVIDNTTTENMSENYSDREGSFSPTKGYQNLLSKFSDENKGYFTISEEEEGVINNAIEDKISELNAIFEKKKSSHGPNKFQIKGGKKDYIHIDFSEGIYFGMTYSQFEHLIELSESALNHLFEIKTLFYVANSCARDITQDETIQVRNDSEEEHYDAVDDPIDIDDLLDSLEPIENVQKSLSTIPHKSLFKLDITWPKIQLDLIDESGRNVEGQVYSIHKEEILNPFESNYQDLKKSNSNQESEILDISDTRLCLLSLIIETVSFKLNMLEQINCPDQTKKLKINLSMTDCLLANNLFLCDADLNTKLSPVSESIPLHPKLFNQKLPSKYSFKSYFPNISNILIHHPERVIVYRQRGIQELNDGVDFLDAELYIIIKTDKKAVADQFTPAEGIVNLYRSLDQKLQFELFSKYWCIFYEPEITNQVYLSLNLKWLVFQISNIHDWCDFIPHFRAKGTAQKSDFIQQIDNSINIKLDVRHLCLDYTPWVTSKSIMEVYKNYEYNYEDEEELFYKSNTRVIASVDSIALTFSNTPDSTSLDLKMTDFVVSLLWTRDFSEKWSADVLLDEKNLITSINSSLLQKCGFVNVLNLRSLTMRMGKSQLEVNPKTNKPYRELSSFASLPDLNDAVEFPKLIMCSSIEDRDKTDISVEIGEILGSVCHDSIIGLLLFSSTAALHIEESLSLMTEQIDQVAPKEDLFSGVIKEVDEEQEDGLDLRDYLEEGKYNKIKELELDRNLSDFSREIRQSFEFVDHEEEKKETEEQSAHLFEPICLTDNYLNEDSDIEALSKWHAIKMPKSELSSSIYTGHVTVPKFKFYIDVKKIELRIYEGQDFCFQSSEGLDKQVKQTVAQGFDKTSTINSMRRETFIEFKEIKNTALLDFEPINDFFGSEEEEESKEEIAVSEDVGRIRKKKRSAKRFISISANFQFSFMDLTDSIEGIDSQIGFTLEKLSVDVIQSNSQQTQIFWFDNDLHNHKNLWFKIIYLQNKTPLNERWMEFYFKSEQIRINIDYLWITFGYLIAQPIILFINNEMKKDEEFMNKIKERTEKVDLSKSISVKRIEEEVGIQSSVWKITDENPHKKPLIYIKYLHIQPFKIKLNYKWDNLNVIHLVKGDLLNFFTNLVDISELRIKIREFKVDTKTRLELTIGRLIEFYLNDLVYNQKLNLLASVYPIRVTINIMKAFATLFTTPMKKYMNEGYVLIGIYDGFTKFLSKITIEFSDVGSKLLSYIGSWKNFIKN